MGTTTTGLPYPEPSDPVAAGADNIRALATAIDPRLSQMSFATLPIPVTVDAQGAAFADWLYLNTPAPAWARYALIVTTLSGHYLASGAGTSAFELRTGIGTVYGLPASIFIGAAGARPTDTWVDGLAIPAGGPVKVAIQARRTFGDGVLRADSGSNFRFHLTYLAAAPPESTALG